MPIYEYACTACGRRIDVVHGIHAEGPSTCEACGGVMKKALTAPAIHFKGSGWAKKDARAAAAPATPAAATKEDAPASGETASGETAAPAGGAAPPTSDTPAPAAVPAAPAPAPAAPATSTTGG